MPNIIPSERSVQEDDGILGKVRRFVNLKRQIDDLTKEQSVIKTFLSDVVDTEGEPDEKGHLFYPLPEEVDGYKSLQRQRRVSQRLDEDAAQALLKERGLHDRCFELMPVLKEDEVMACLYEGLLSEEDVDTMFPKSVTWAFVPVKS